MTEAEWLACANPTPMFGCLRALGVVRGMDPKRKIWLFAREWCRPVAARLREPPNPAELAEATRPDPAAGAVHSRSPMGRLAAVIRDTLARTGTPYLWNRVAAATRDFVAVVGGGEVAGRTERVLTNAFRDALRNIVAEEGEPVPGAADWSLPPGGAALVRDIFGNPFRPLTLDPSSLTSTVTALAREMYDSRDFSAMPILADALQDAGCEREDILDHCRGAGPHVRGCWVVDLVLSKE